MENKKVLFKDLAIGARFIDKTYGHAYLVYEKATPSTAKVVLQVGYGNTRSVGNVMKFGPFRSVRTEVLHKGMDALQLAQLNDSLKVQSLNINACPRSRNKGFSDTPLFVVEQPKLF